LSFLCSYSPFLFFVVVVVVVFHLWSSSICSSSALFFGFWFLWIRSNTHWTFCNDFHCVWRILSHLVEISKQSTLREGSSRSEWKETTWPKTLQQLHDHLSTKSFRNQHIQTSDNHFLILILILFVSDNQWTDLPLVTFFPQHIPRIAELMRNCAQALRRVYISSLSISWCSSLIFCAKFQWNFSSFGLLC
jgi:hypothetical protein